MAFWGATDFFAAVGPCRVMSLEKKKFQLKKHRFRKNHRRGHRTRARARINITPQTYRTEEVGCCVCVCVYALHINRSGLNCMLYDGVGIELVRL